MLGLERYSVDTADITSQRRPWPHKGVFSSRRGRAVSRSARWLCRCRSALRAYERLRARSTFFAQHHEFECVASIFGRGPVDETPPGRIYGEAGLFVFAEGAFPYVGSARLLQIYPIGLDQRHDIVRGTSKDGVYYVRFNVHGWRSREWIQRLPMQSGTDAQSRGEARERIGQNVLRLPLCFTALRT
jgi:hypothetical protein